MGGSQASSGSVTWRLPQKLMLRSRLGPSESISECLGWGSAVCLLAGLPGDSDAHSSLRTVGQMAGNVYVLYFFIDIDIYLYIP